MSRAAVVVLGTLAATAAAASPLPAAPFVTPQRDADVTYRVAASGGSASTQRMRWSAQLWRQRLDTPERTSMITDYRSQTLLIVDWSRRQALLLAAPVNRVQPPGQRATGAYAPAGERVIAGVPCNDWRTTDDHGAVTTVCFTADGVMLRAIRDDRTLVEADRVSYAPQPADLFRAPADIVVRRAASR